MLLAVSLSRTLVACQYPLNAPSFRVGFRFLFVPRCYCCYEDFGATLCWVDNSSRRDLWRAQEPESDRILHLQQNGGIWMRNWPVACEEAHGITATAKLERRRLEDTMLFYRFSHKDDAFSVASSCLTWLYGYTSWGRAPPEARATLAWRYCRCCKLSNNHTFIKRRHSFNL
jgi:hypothetical protein